MKGFPKDSAAITVADIGQARDLKVETAVVEFLNRRGGQTCVLEEDVHE